MGEKIKDIAEIKIGTARLKVEINEPLSIGRDYQIHIQNKKLRFECEMADFLAMAGVIIDANKELERIKNGNNEQLLWKIKHN